MTSPAEKKTPLPEWDLLLSAAQKNRPDMIQYMVQEGGVDPSHANSVGQSALHIAALWGNCTCSSPKKTKNDRNIHFFHQ